MHPLRPATIRTLPRGGIAGDPSSVIGEIPCYAHPCWAGARVCSLRTAMVSIDITSSKKRFSLKPIREPVRVVWECLNDVLLNPYTQSNTHIMSHTTRHNKYYSSGQWTNQKHCLATCKRKNTYLIYNINKQTIRVDKTITQKDRKSMVSPLLKITLAVLITLTTNQLKVLPNLITK